MKKVLLFTFAVAMFAGLSSCSKDYTCTCNYNDGTTDQTTTVVYEGVKKDEAEEACTASEIAFKIIDANASCSL